MLERRLTDAADGVRKALGDLVPPPVTNLVSSPRPDTPLQTGSSPGWRGPLIAVATAAAIIAVVGVSLLMIRSGGPFDIADEPIATTVLEQAVTTTTAAPTVDGSVPVVWDPILATTKAKAAPPAATCPPGSDPNRPGMVDQARPDLGYAGNQAAAFDRHTGRIVYVDAANETWTFDVCTNTWQQMNPTGIPERDRWGGVVYDADSDRLISLRSTGSSVYDPNTNTWTPISDREAMPGDHRRGSWTVNGAVYDPVSGLVLAQYDQLETDLTVLSAYDVDTDRWTRVGPLDGQAWRNLIGYAPQTDRLVFAGYERFLGTGIGAPSYDEGPSFFRSYDKGPPLVVDPRTGTATATEQGASIMGSYGIISYAAGTDTALVATWPDNEICWFDPRSLTWDNCLEADYPPDVEGQGFGAMVGDPINNRLVLINPERGQNPAGSAVWAVDLDTGEWTQLLAPPTP
jgi:hypothetical protein